MSKNRESSSTKFSMFLAGFLQRVGMAGIVFGIANFFLNFTSRWLIVWGLIIFLLGTFIGFKASVDLENSRDAPKIPKEN